MVQELLPFLPPTLTSAQVALCVILLIAGVLLWLIGSAWSRGILTLLAVAVGGTLGMLVPRWQLWPINSMAAAVLGAVGFGLSAYLVDRLWAGLTLGIVLIAWAVLGTWIVCRPTNFEWKPRAAWEVAYMTPPQRASDIWERLPDDVRKVMPYWTGLALLSGLSTALLWPRMGRALCFSVAGVTMMFIFGLALVATRRVEWLHYVPSPPLSQAGVLAGLVLVGVLAQWQLKNRAAREHDAAGHAGRGEMDRDRVAQQDRRPTEQLGQFRG